MSIKIQVIEEDIKNGERRNSHKCPVALACIRVLNKDWAEVFDNLQSNNVDGGMGVFNQWPILSKFITSFDENKPVEPFEIELPDYIKN